MKITTMSGHGLVSVALARKVIADVKNGRISCREGATILARPCICGLMNPVRTEALLGQIAGRGGSE